MAESQLLQHGKALAGVPLDQAGDLHLYSSRDGGHTWRMLTKHKWLDSTAMTLDSSRGSRRGRMYLFGADKDEHSSGASSEIQVVTSDDGRRLQGPVSLPKLNGFSYVGAYASDARVLPNHDAVAVFMTRRQIRGNAESRPFATHVEVFAAGNGGLTLQRLVDLGVIQPCIGGMPALDVNRTTGSIYVVWGNLQNGRCQLEIAHSVGGHKWSSPRPITTTQDGYDPSIAVNDKGIIGLFWLETTLEKKVSQCWRFSTSLDNGLTFSSPVQVSRCEPTGRRAALSSSVYASPDVHVRRNGPGWDIDSDAAGFSAIGARDGMIPWRTGLATDRSGGFHAVWPELTDQGGALWSATINVGTSPTTLTLDQSATDISRILALELSNSEFDEASGIYSVNVRATNTGTKTIRGPIFLRVDDFYSKFFDQVRVIGSDNGVASKGAMWTIWPEEGSSVLKPGKRTTSRRLSFLLSNSVARPVIFGDLLAVKMRIFSDPCDCLRDDEGFDIQPDASNWSTDPQEQIERRNH